MVAQYTARVRRVILAATVILLLFAACRNPTDDYFTRSLSNSNTEARELYAILRPLLLQGIDDQEPNSSDYSPQQRAVAAERLAGHLARAGDGEAMVTLLTMMAERVPDDPYGAYYLYLVARHYQELGEIPLARHYYVRVVEGYEDLRVHDLSLHVHSLTALIEMTADPRLLAKYYRRLIEEHGSSIDQGRAYYFMAKALEELGEWSAAYAAYREFVRYPETKIPGRPRAHEEVTARLAFFDSDRSWVVRRLEDLKARITWAIYNKDAETFLRYQAKVNFFTRSWEQENSDPNATPDWDIGSLLQRSGYVEVAGEIDMSSNADEAFLYTYGWGLRIKTWYLYFRRVDFPADPEINDSWEWAGVFLGERL